MLGIGPRLRAAPRRDRPVGRCHRRQRDGDLRRPQRQRRPVAARAARRVPLRHRVGAVIGFFVARVGIPSFVVTLGLFLGLQGLALLIIGEGGLYRLDVPELRALQNGNLPVWGGWVMLAIMLAVSAGHVVLGSGPPHACGCAEPSAVAGVDQARRRSRCWAASVVYFLNLDRGQSINVVQGVPNIIPVTLVHPLDRHVRARPHEVRPLHLRHRRQRRGRTPRRHQGAVDQVVGVRHLLVARGRRGAVQRHARRLGRRDASGATSS